MKKNKLLAIILTLAMVCSIVPFGMLGAFAADGTCGDNLTWELVDGVLTISGTGEMYDYDEEEDPAPWDSEKENITSVVIGNGVTSIGDDAFYYCTSLTNIEIPDGVTSIARRAFYGCTNLTTISVGNNISDLGSDVFEGTAYYNNEDNWENGLLYLTARDNSTHYLVDADRNISGAVTVKEGTKLICDGAFEDCTSLESIVIPKGITSIGGNAFAWCENLTSIEIPDSVTSIGDSAFSDCTSLTSIEIPDSVTSIGGNTFFNCTSLTSIEIPDSVTSISYGAFAYCTNLATISVGNNISDLEHYVFDDTAYYNNEDNRENGLLYLTSRDNSTHYLLDADEEISGNVTIKEGTKLIGGNAFAWCENLTSIEIPDSVTSIGRWAFDGCTNLATISVGNNISNLGSYVLDDTAYYNNEDNWENEILYLTARDNSTHYLIKADEEISGNVTIKEGTKVIGRSAFEECQSLTSVTFGRNINSIEALAFDDCSEDLIFYGYKGTVPEEYATKYEITFIALDDDFEVGEDSENEDITTVDLSLVYKLLNDEMINPGETFVFNIEKYSVTDSAYTLDTMPMFENNQYEIAFVDGEAVIAGDTNTATLNLPEYEHVGIYTYVITQEAGNTAGVTYDANPLYLKITVIQGEDGLLRVKALHYATEDGDKTLSFTNVYSAGDIAITGETKGNLGARDKEFEVTVTFTVEEGKALNLPIICVEDEVETAVEADENGNYVAVISIKDGKTVVFKNVPYGTKYTVAEGDHETYELTYSVENIDTDGDTVDTALELLTITNRKDMLIDEGLLLDSMPYMITLMGIGAAVVVILAKKRRKVEED